MKKTIFVFVLFFNYFFIFGQDVMSKSKTILDGGRFELIATDYFLRGTKIKSDVSLNAVDDSYTYSIHDINLYSAPSDSVLSFINYAIDFFSNNGDGTIVLYKNLTLKVYRSQFLYKLCVVSCDDGYRSFSISELKRIQKSLLKFSENAKH